MSNMRDLLIVDDDDNMRTTLAEILAEDGFDVAVAASGEEAVEICQRESFRLILMDVRMPGIDGVEACRRIRSHCKRSQIVIMSAQAEAEMERLALRAGVMSFLRKPLDVEAIIQLITEATSRLVLYVATIGPGARLFQQQLTQSGIRSTFVGTIEEALALLEQIHYDALVLDLEAIEEGENAIASVRDYHPAIPLVLVSPPGRSVDHLRETAYAVLESPLAPEALVGRIGRIRRGTNA